MQSVVRVLAEHWPIAALECLVFVMGMFSAVVVLRYRLEFLMRFPRWIMGRMLAFLARRPGFGAIFLLIFVFNTTAIFVYMMTGALLGILPTAISFLTGMNIGIVAGSMPVPLAGLQRDRPPRGVSSASEANPDNPEAPSAADEAPGGQAPRAPGSDPAARISRSEKIEAVCFLVVACLELPVFWLSMAMGSKMATGAAPGALSVNWEAVLARLLTYAVVCVPALAVSAVVETVGIRHGLSKGALGPSPPGA